MNQNLKTKLESCYLESDENTWIAKNMFIFEQAACYGLALAGSIAISIAKKSSKKPPGDIDFVCSSASDAMNFIQSLQYKLLKYKSHWRVYVNHNNQFTPPGCITHFRFSTAMWLPICIMVIPHENFKFYLINGGLRIQTFSEVKKAAMSISLIDKKERDLSVGDVDEEELKSPIKNEKENQTQDISSSLAMTVPKYFNLDKDSLIF